MHTCRMGVLPQDRAVGPAADRAVSVFSDSCADQYRFDRGAVLLLIAFMEWFAAAGRITG